MVLRVQPSCEFLGALRYVKYQFYDYINMTGSTHRILDKNDIWNWNVKFQMGKSIMTCRAKSRFVAKRWSCKCKLLYHQQGNLCRCRNLGFLKTLTLSVSFIAVEEKKVLKENALVWAVIIVMGNYIFLSARIWIQCLYEKCLKWTGFWKLKSLGYCVLLKLGEQSRYLEKKTNPHVIYEVNGR